MGYSRPLLRTHPARRLAQFRARVLSRASVPGPSLPLGPRRLEPPRRALKLLLQPRTLGGGRSPHTEGNLASKGPRTPFSKHPGRRPAGTRGACLAGHADGRGLAGLPYSRCQTLSLTEGRGLLGCAGSWPMGAVKGVALGTAGAALRVFPQPARLSQIPGSCSLAPRLVAVGPARLAIHTKLRDPHRPRSLCPPKLGPQTPSRLPLIYSSSCVSSS